MSYTKCNECDDPKPNCGCAKPKPKILSACTPGHFYRIDCEAYKATCVPKGFPFWVLPGDGCCEGLHIGSGDKGTAMDRVLIARNFAESPDFSMDGCLVSIEWDRICNAAERVDDAGNADALLICTDKGVKAISLADLLKDACLSAPTELDGCGASQQVVIQEREGKPGCWELGVLSAQAKKPYRATASYDDMPVPLDGIKVWPDAYPVGYTLEDLHADDANGNGTVDEAKLHNNVVSGASFTLKCKTRYSATISGSLSPYPDIQDAFASRTALIVRYRVDGGAWQYRRSNSPTLGQNVLSTIRSFNGISTTYEGAIGIDLPAGEIDVELLAFVLDDQTQATRIVVRAWPSNSGYPNGPDIFFEPVTL